MPENLKWNSVGWVKPTSLFIILSPSAQGLAIAKNVYYFIILICLVFRYSILGFS